MTDSARSDAALAEHWLETGALLTLPDPTAPKQYPKRSELRRAEARAANRRGADRRPAGGRPPGGAAGGHRPPSPSGARLEGARRPSPYSGSAPRLPLALAPRPAALPISQTATASRPAGIDLRVSPPTGSIDAFHAPEQTGPMVPIVVPASPADLFAPTVPPTGSLSVIPPRIAPDGAPVAPIAPPELAAPAAAEVEAAEWGLDLEDTQLLRRKSLDEEIGRPRTRRKPGTKVKKAAGRKVRAARMLVLALVVGAEGVALTTMTGTARPIHPDTGNLSSAFEHSPAAAGDTVARAASAALTPTTPASQAAGTALDAITPAQAQRDSSAGKVSAAIAQAKAAADRVKAAAARRAKILRDAQSDPKSVAKMLLADRGWGSGQFECLNLLWTRESGWNYRAYNASSGAYGIPQALPGGKMGADGSDWRTNPVTQIRWGLSYISSRYGTPCGAWGHETSHGWY